MDTRREMQQVMWEVIADMERTRLMGDDDQAWWLERIAWRLAWVLGRGGPDSKFRKH